MSLLAPMDKRLLIRPHVQAEMNDVGAEVRNLLERAYSVAVRRRERLKQEIARICLSPPYRLFNPVSRDEWFANAIGTGVKQEFKNLSIKQETDETNRPLEVTYRNKLQPVQPQPQQPRNSVKRGLSETESVNVKIVTPRPAKRPRTVLALPTGGKKITLHNLLWYRKRRYHSTPFLGILTSIQWEILQTNTKNGRRVEAKVRLFFLGARRPIFWTPDDDSKISIEDQQFLLSCLALKVVPDVQRFDRVGPSLTDNFGPNGRTLRTESTSFVGFTHYSVAEDNADKLREFLLAGGAFVSGDPELDLKPGFAASAEPDLKPGSADQKRLDDLVYKHSLQHEFDGTPTGPWYKPITPMGRDRAGHGNKAPRTLVKTLDKTDLLAISKDAVSTNGTLHKGSKTGKKLLPERKHAVKENQEYWQEMVYDEQDEAEIDFDGDEEAKDDEEDPNDPDYEDPDYRHHQGNSSSPDSSDYCDDEDEQDASSNQRAHRNTNLASVQRHQSQHPSHRNTGPTGPTQGRTTDVIRHQIPPPEQQRVTRVIYRGPSTTTTAAPLTSVIPAANSTAATSFLVAATLPQRPTPSQSETKTSLQSETKTPVSLAAEIKAPAAVVSAPSVPPATTDAAWPAAVVMLSLTRPDVSVTTQRVSQPKSGPTSALMTSIASALASGPITSGSITSGPITSGSIASGPTTSGSITSGPTTPNSKTSESKPLAVTQSETARIAATT